MSDQGPLPDRDADFGLIETLLWTREDGYALLPEHLARLAASSAALGFVHDAERVKEALDAAVPPTVSSPSTRPGGSESLPFTGRVVPRRGAGWGQAQEPRFGAHPNDAASFESAKAPDRLRIRLVLARNGAIAIGATPIEPIPPGTIWRVALARRRFDSRDPMLRHKTTRRALYEEELAQAVQNRAADEVLFLNERDELCESARGNLFVPSGGSLLTPPVSSGILPGTLRAHLLAQGRAQEALLRLSDLPRDFYLGNSVRGLVGATLLP